MGRRILLVRHCEVREEYRSTCYGRSDIGLSAEGEAHSLRLVEQLVTSPITHLFHSGLSRTHFLAELVSLKVGVAAVADTDLRERNFGTWELQTWDEIFGEVGHAMDGLILDPANYAPPGGETPLTPR